VKAVEAENLIFSYVSPESKSKSLSDVSVEIEKGEFIAVLGKNGSGKTTLARHFNALLSVQGGKLVVAALDASDKSNVWEIRKNCSMVFQNPDNQFVSTLVEEDVAFGVENLGIPSAEIRARVDEALKTVGMYEFREKAPHKLSGGQKQRVAVAGIIAMKPQCIVLDEPTAMLDPSGRKEVIETVKKLNREENITIVLITHYMDEAVEADRVIVVDSGEIKMDDTPENVFARVDEVKALGLDVPQSTELIYRLGLETDKTILNADACVEFIKRSLED